MDSWLNMYISEIIFTGNCLRYLLQTFSFLFNLLNLWILIVCERKYRYKKTS